MIKELDEAVAKWAANAVQPRHVRPLRTITHLGGTELVVSVAALAGAVSRARSGSWSGAIRLGTVVVGQNLAHNLIKGLTNRSRPDGPHHSFFSGTSFPSGHTTTAAASWPAIVSAFSPTPTPFARVAALAAGPAVGSTRVLLGVHWLSDVVAGLLLGWGWLGLTRLVSPSSRR